MFSSASTCCVLWYVAVLLVVRRAFWEAEAKRPVQKSFTSYLPSGVLKDRTKSGDKFPPYLPTALLKDRGKTESRLPEPLLQTAMTYYQTLPSDVDPEELMRKLGSRFDSKWMSVDRPHEQAHPLQVAPATDFDPELLSDLRRLNFTYVDDDAGLVTLKPHLQKIVEKWLLQKSSCPVVYRWHDVGPFFWPRWLKKGSCSNERACSWPPGMHCVPSSRPMTVRILRWHCRPRVARKHAEKRNDPPRDPPKSRKRKPKNRAKLRRPFRLKCRWRKVRYPITTECFCTC